MVSLTFHGGENKIRLEDGDPLIWLDFGKSFTMRDDYSRASRFFTNCGEQVARAATLIISAKTPADAPENE